MDWLHEAGLPTMRWSLAADHAELDGLFDRWSTDAILIKPSDTFGGKSVTLFTRDRVPEIRWDPQRDLFCPEVNPDDGDIYKLEMFGRTELVGWMSRVPPARVRMHAGRVDGLYGAYGRRERFEWSERLLEPARRFGAQAIDRGFGHFSVDLMRNPRGEFEAIEVNLGNVAVWWTTQFRSFRHGYARAVHEVLVEKHGAPREPVDAATRARFRIAGWVRSPSVLYREAQGVWWRWRNSRSLESKHAAPRATERR
jgi:hypothetical protein